MTQKPSLDEIFSKYDNRIYKRKPSQPKEPPGILDDLWEGAKDYVEGAKLGLAEIGRAREAVMGNIRPIANPLLEPEPGSPNFASYYVSQYQHVTKDAPVMNDEEQRIWNWYVGAGDSFRDNTLAPAAATVATVATIPALLAGAGIAVTGAAATVATTASLAYTPFMVNDIAGSLYEKGVVETGKEVGMSMIPGVANYMQESDPKFQKYAEEHPGQALWHRGTTFLDSFAPLAHPTGKLGRKVYDSSKEPLHRVIQEVQATEFMEAMKEKRLFDTIKDLKKRVEEGKVKPQPPSKEESIAHNVAIGDELERMENQNGQSVYTYTNGGRRILVAPSTLSSPVRARDIMGTLKRLAAVDVGYLRDADPAVLGYFETFSEAIRVRGRLDYGVMIHELGHRLDKLFRIQGADKELVDLYLRTWGADTYAPHLHRTEGIAEFTREYLLNPTTAQQVCPEFYKSFEAVLNQNPEIRNTVNLLGDQLRSWLNQSPEARVRGIIVFDEDTPLREKFRGLLSKTKKNFVDQYTHLKDLIHNIEETTGTVLSFSENPYNKAKGLMSRTGAWVNLLLRKKYSDHHAAALEKLIGRNIFPCKTWWADVWSALEWGDFSQNSRLRNYMEQHGFRNPREAFTTYITAKHMIEIMDEMQRRGISEWDYNTPITYADAQAVVQNTPPELVAVSMKLREFNANILALMEHFGFIDRATRNVLSCTYSDYVPFHRYFEIEEAGLGGENSPLRGNSASSILYELSEHGSDRSIKDPLFEYENIVRSIVARGLKNEVNRSITNLYTRVEGMGAFFQRIDDDAPVDTQRMTFAVWRNGNREIYKAIDPLLYEILHTESPQQVTADMKILQLTSTIFREGITSAVDFGIRTAIVDSFQAFVNTKSKKIIPLIPIVDNILGVFNMVRDRELKAEMEVMGVTHSTFINSARAHRTFVADQMGQKLISRHPFRSIRESSPHDILDWGFRVALKAHDTVTYINQKAEESTRFQEYRRMRRQGMSMEEAAQVAREVTVDFTQAGTTARRWNKYIPFLNANIQSHRIYWNKLSGDQKKLVYSRMGILTLASMYLWQLQHKEQWYQDLDNDIKNRYWVFNIGDNMLLKVPKPFDYGVHISVMERILDYYVANQEDAPESLEPYIKGVLDINRIPPIVNVIYECSTNHNFFTGRDIVPKSLQKLSPENQWNTKTSYIARGLGKLTGESPMLIDHAIKQTFGTAGKTILRASDEALTLGNTGRPEGDLSTNPFTFGLVADETKNSKYLNIFYESYREMETAYEDAKQAKKKPKKPKVWRSMKDAYDKIGILNGDIKNIDRETKYSPHQKAALLKQKRKERNEIAKKAVEKYQQTK